jgi:hypothetical protein
MLCRCIVTQSRTISFLSDLGCGVLQGYGDVQLVARIVEAAVERLTLMQRMPVPALVRHAAGPHGMCQPCELPAHLPAVHCMHVMCW